MCVFIYKTKKINIQLQLQFKCLKRKCWGKKNSTQTRLMERGAGGDLVIVTRYALCQLQFSSITHDQIDRQHPSIFKEGSSLNFPSLWSCTKPFHNTIAPTHTCKLRVWLFSLHFWHWCCAIVHWSS